MNSFFQQANETYFAQVEALLNQYDQSNNTPSLGDPATCENSLIEMINAEELVGDDDENIYERIN